jgi:hypothetical protein
LSAVPGAHDIITTTPTTHFEEIKQHAGDTGIDLRAIEIVADGGCNGYKPPWSARIVKG